MTICVLGKNLTALLISKILVNKGLKVDIFFRDKNKERKNSRTIGLSNNSVDFFSREFHSLEIGNISNQIKEKGYFAFSKAINKEAINRIHQDATQFKLNLNNNDIRQYII